MEIPDEIHKILDEDLYNDTYGRLRMFEAIKLRHKNDPKFHIPSARTIYRIMKILGLSHHPKRNPHSITKGVQIIWVSDIIEEWKK